jgi:hypothetical protein
MGIHPEVERPQWLFTTTFVPMPVDLPLFGGLNSVVPRAQFVGAGRNRQAPRVWRLA